MGQKYINQIYLEATGILEILTIKMNSLDSLSSESKMKMQGVCLLCTFAIVAMFIHLYIFSFKQL